MNEHLPFDEFARKKFEHFEPEVPSRIWENIIADKERKPKGFWVTFFKPQNMVWLALLGAGLVFLSIYLSSNNSQPKTEAVSSKNSTTTQSTENNNSQTAGTKRQVEITPDGDGNSKSPGNDMVAGGEAKNEDRDRGGETVAVEKAASTKFKAPESRVGVSYIGSKSVNTKSRKTATSSAPNRELAYGRSASSKAQEQQADIEAEREEARISYPTFPWVITLSVSCPCVQLNLSIFDSSP